MNNKQIFATNFKRLMELKGVSRKEIAQVLGLSYFTVSDWVNGKKYPRMDKVEILANYFGVTKSDLIEETSENLPQPQTLTEGEELLLDLFRRVPESEQQMVLDMIRVALNKH